MRLDQFSFKTKLLFCPTLYKCTSNLWWMVGARTPCLPLNPPLHSSEETSQRRRAVGDIMSDLNDPRIEPYTSRSVSVSLRQQRFIFAGFLPRTTPANGDIFGKLWDCRSDHNLLRWQKHESVRGVCQNRKSKVKIVISVPS